MGPVNVNEIGGIAIAEIIKASFKNVVGGIGGISKQIYQRIFEDFEPYMNECYQRNRFVRILCQGDVDVDLLKIYVPTTFTFDSDRITDDDIVAEIGSGENYIITGNGGAGKTFFMRKLWIDLFKVGTRTPLFIELRKLNDLSTFDLQSFVRASISNNLDAEVFEKLCLEGRFVLILDGFDELPTEKYEEIQNQILKISEKFPKCPVVVSSRPDGRFSGWSTFSRVEAAPFSLDQTKELCLKIPFEEKYRKAFVKSLTAEFYNKYMSFLSNPLLSIMMMMTFRRNMDIPVKMGIFYDEAFNTLFQWHDATKAFKRKKNLDILEFRKSFGVFCLLSYTKQKFDFSHSELEDLVEASSNLIDLDIKKSKILSDYERNVNLIRQDGLRYYFIHRSFQEYFAAWALTNVFPHKFADFSKLIESRRADNVLKMCYDLQRPLVVKEYINSNYEKLEATLGSGKKLSSREIWDNKLFRLSLHFESSTPSLDRSESIGIGIKIDPEFANFFRNVSKMRDEFLVNDGDYLLSKPIVRHGIFNRVGIWLGKCKFFNGDAALAIAEVNLREGNIYIHPVNDEQVRVGENVCIKLTKSDVKMFNEATKGISEVIHQMSQWCKSEIALVHDTDSELDKLFLS